MLKKELNSTKSDKKNFFKRREEKSKFRSINNYQIIDKIPNDNLYKNDNIYSINKNFEFSPNEEESFRLFFHYYFQKDGLKGILILIYFRLLSSNINTIKDIVSFFKVINCKNIFHLISLIISFILTKEDFIRKEIFNVYLYYIFSFNHSIHIFSIYHNSLADFQKHLTILSELLFNLILLFFLDARIKYSIFPFSINIIIFLYSAKIIPNLNILFYLALGIAFSIILYMLMLKSIREIWALYDSFKRSYYNMNQGLLDSDPNPIFILSKDKRVLFKNTAAMKLINNILETQNAQKKIKRSKEDKISNSNLIDIIHPNLRELFTKLLNDAMEDETVSSFNFPLCKKNNQNDLNLDVSSAYDINDEKNYLYFIWYSILVCKTEWKNKVAFYMCLFTSDDVLLNEIFYQYTKRFSEKIEKVICSSDIIISAFVNKMYEKEVSSSSANSLKKSNNEEYDEEDGEKKENQRRNIYKLLIENADNIELNNTILYFFKNQVELLYDYSLTLELYFTMLYNQRNFKHNFENKKQNSKKRIKLNDLKAYYSEYFYDFIKEHNYKLEFKNDDNINVYDIFIEENYLRIILFNVIVFMICFLDAKTEQELNNKKEILIKIIPEIKEDISSIPISPESHRSHKGNEEQAKFTPKSSDSNDKNIKKGELSFIFESFSPNINLNKIQELLNQKNKNNCQIKEEIIKLNYFDIGILTVKYLLQNYYKTNINLYSKEGDQFIEFKLPCELELIGVIDSSRKIYDIEAGANSFFTSPLLHPKRNKNINKPKNFYNYNQNYNKKVLNIFYGIEKSPEIKSRHRRGLPSFSVLNEEKNRQRRYLRHLSQNIQQFSNKNVANYSTDQNKYFYLNDNNNNKKESDKNQYKIKSKNSISKFSFKQMDFSFESGSFKSDRIEEEADDNILNNKITELLENEKLENKSYVIIFENQNNKDFISFLNNENKGEYILKIFKEIHDIEVELKNNKGNIFYKIILINMGNIKEIKFAEKFCENKGESLLFGYHFGVHTKSKEKNNVKFDKRFDLSFSYEGILYALNQNLISSSSIIK